MLSLCLHKAEWACLPFFTRQSRDHRQAGRLGTRLLPDYLHPGHLGDENPEKMEAKPQPAGASGKFQWPELFCEEQKG